MDLIISEAKTETVDVPVCACVVKDDKILSLQTNKKEKLNDVTAHAEILALKEASKALNNWRLEGCDMYVTLEPCPMCLWAIINSRIKNLYFGSFDHNSGGFSSGLNLLKLANSSLEVEGGKEEGECDKILKEYFESLRNEKNT